MKIFIFTLLGFIYSNIYAQNQHIWSKRFGSNTNDFAENMARDVSGNIFITGRFEGTATFGSNSVTSASGRDIFIAKYDADGNNIWVKRLGGSNNDSGEGIAVDGSGNIVVIGYFSSSIDLGPSTINSAGNEDVFLVKYDTDGNYIWGKTFGAGGSDFGYNCAIDASNNIAITGSFRSTVNFGGSDLVAFGVAYSDMFLVKFDASGNHLWSNEYESVYFNNQDNGSCIVFDASGNLFVSGTGRERINFGGGEINPTGDENAFLAKFNPSGGHLWSKSFAGVDPIEENIALNSSGDIFIAINYNGNQIHLAKYDSNGSLLWNKTSSGGGEKRIVSIKADNSGNLVLIGTINDQGSFTDFFGINLSSKGFEDIMLAKLDGDGNLKWANTFGNAASNDGNDVLIDNSNNILLLADATTTQVIDMGGGNLTNTGSMILAKYHPDGSDISVFRGVNAVFYDSNVSISGIPINSTSNTTFTIENRGTADLLLQGTPYVIITGTNASHFAVTTQPSLSTITPNGTTTFVITFQPTIVTLLTATVEIRTNDLDEAIFKFDISGNGLKIPQTITFPAIPSKIYTDSDFTPTVSASSNLMVSLASSNTSVATIDGSTIRIVGVGSTNITASQSGNSNYLAASNVVQPLVVDKANLITTAQDVQRTYKEPNPALTFTLNGLKTGETASVIDIAPVLATTATQNSDVGTFPITISGASDNNYNFSYVNGVFTINKANQTITFNPLANTYANISEYPLTAQISSDLPISFSIDNPNLATLSGNKLLLKGVEGTLKVTASQAGNNNYNPAVSITRDLKIIDPITAIGNDYEGFKIYPNPFESILNIEADACPCELQIQNMEGKVIFQKEVTPFEEINLSLIPSGMYLANFKYLNQSFTKKLIKF